MRKLLIVVGLAASSWALAAEQPSWNPAGGAEGRRERYRGAAHSVFLVGQHRSDASGCADRVRQAISARRCRGRLRD